MHARQCTILVMSVFLFFYGLLTPDARASDRCDEWVGKIVSVQGSVQVRSKGSTQWTPVLYNGTFCPGDMLRVQDRSRAAIYLVNNTLIRIEQNTTLTFTAVEKKDVSWIDLLSGAVHFMSRIPRSLKVSTPFVDGTVEGTEFFVQVLPDHAVFTVFEGIVLASNQTGTLSLESGRSARTHEGEAPVPYMVVRPRDSVQWALYYPPVLSYQAEDMPMIGESLRHYWQGDLTKAFTGIKDVPEGTGDARFFNYRAALLLSVGSIDEAQNDINQALGLSPGNSDSAALQSIIAVVNNNKEEALNIAQKAVEADPDSATAKIALSYARQAHFDLEGALASLREAVALHPDNALVWARLSELELSFGNLDKALESANRAVELNPDLARTQTVLGYAYLTQVKIDDAREAFNRAIVLDQADPLPRLGLGLAMIRKGKLAEGREEIEIATSLDPNNSLMRSYAGKAYYEEKRDKLAMSQYDMAKELDPLDPTPYFYDAIRRQTINRPVEALDDLQKSIELNDNRAVYRSKELLDDDLASRSASLGRIYNDLGFEQLALVEGWNSINTDPANYSAHRFLADAYSALPRHEIARVSELLQSQLLQPLNITPVQPQLAESNLFIFSGSNPGTLSFNEFNPLFNRNRVTLQVSGIAGENGTFGDELVISGVHDKYSFSLGQFHHETDGFRENNDQEHDIYNVFVQTRFTHKTTGQIEFRYKETEKGDLSLNFDPDTFIPTLREIERSHSLRAGLHHSLTKNSEIIASFIYSDLEEDVSLKPVLEVSFEEDGFMGEIQHLFHAKRLKIISGAGYFDSDIQQVSTSNIIIPGLPPISEKKTEENDIHHINVYIYSLIDYPENVTWTLGGSGDFFDSDTIDKDQFNPKIGVTWAPFPDTTLRAAAFRVLKRLLMSNQTIEPTQVAGFNQFYDDFNVTESWRYGIAIDQKFSKSIYGGMEYSERDLEVPFKENREDDWEEDLFRAYLYWTPARMIALNAEYQYEEFTREEFFSDEEIKSLETHRVPLGINFHHPCGFSARITTTYVDQEGEFFDPFLKTVSSDNDEFWVVDASIGFRLPKRRGIISVEAKNLFDEDFMFQDTDPVNPKIYPERAIFGKFTLSF